MKNYGAKVFDDEGKINRLFKLARDNKHSSTQLAQIFGCGKTTIFGVLNKFEISLANSGKFKRKYYPAENFFIKLTPKSTYWAGFIVADGCLYSKNGKNKVLSIGLSKIDLHHLINFQKAIKNKSKVSYIKSNNSVSVRTCSIAIFDSLISLGIVPNKSFKMGEVKIPDKFMSHFIRGVFDGDGSLSGKKVTHLQVSIAGHVPLLRQIQNVFIKKCGVRKVSLYPASYTDVCTISRLQYTGSQIFRILSFLYKNSTEQTRLKRKYEKYILLKNKFPLSFKENNK